MAKKAANTNTSLPETTAIPSSLANKASASRTRKHVKAQAVAVAAAVEGFVTSIVSPAKPAETTEVIKPASHAPKSVTHEDVSRLAYRFYLERQGQGGTPADDWLRAEQTLRG